MIGGEASGESPHPGAVLAGGPAEHQGEQTGDAGGHHQGGGVLDAISPAPAVGPIVPSGHRLGVAISLSRATELFREEVPDAAGRVIPLDDPAGGGQRR